MLRYAADLLTRKQFAKCCLCEPSTALECAKSKLTKQQMADCCRKDPCAAFAYAAYEMDDVEFRYCTGIYPWGALESAPDRLSTEQLLELVRGGSLWIGYLLEDQPKHPLARALAPFVGQLEPETNQAVANAIARGI